MSICQCIVPGVWYHTASANLFWREGNGHVFRTLGTIVGGSVALRLWGPVRNWDPASEAIRSELVFTLLSMHGDMFSFPPYKNNIEVPSARANLKAICDVNMKHVT